MSDIEKQIELSPFNFLIEKTIQLDQWIYGAKFNFLRFSNDDFTWVVGLSEVEIKDFSSIYFSTRDEIVMRLDLIGHPKLKSKLNQEFLLMSEFTFDEYLLNTNDIFFILKPFFILRIIRKTNKFKSMLNEIKLSSEKMKNLIENKEWLDL